MFHVFKDFRVGQPADADDKGISRPRGGTLLATRLLTILWIGVLSLEFFPAHLALALVALISVAMFVRLYRQLEASYRWFESGFLSAFKPAPKNAGGSRCHARACALGCALGAT